jgi:hypothetical protein
MMDKMSQDSSKSIYKHRMGMVEHTFGHDKHNLKSRQVDHIGMEKIRTEKQLRAINYNINRYAKLLKEDKFKKESVAPLKSSQLTLPQTLNMEIKNRFDNYDSCNKTMLNYDSYIQVNIVSV